MTKLTFPVTTVMKRLNGYESINEIISVDQVKASVEKLSLQLTDVESSNIVKTNIQFLKKIVKQVADKRKEFTGPLDAEKRQYMDLEKAFVEPLNKAISDANKSIAAFVMETEKKNREEARKLELEQMKKETFSKEINYFITEAVKAFNEALVSKDNTLNIKAFNKFTNVKQKDSMIVQLADKYQDRKSELNYALDLLFEIGKSISLLCSGKISEEAANETIDEIKGKLEIEFSLFLNDVGEQEEVKITEIKSTEKAVNKSIYHVISYDVIDIKSVPSEFTKVVIDEAAINAFKKNNSDAIIKGDASIAGLKFSWETKVRG